MKTTALNLLSAAIGGDKLARFEFITHHVTMIVALCIVNAAPKGIGTSADLGKLPDVFTKAKMENFAKACAAFKPALTGIRRSVESWDDAIKVADGIVVTALADVAPKVRTAEQIEATKVKKAEKAAAKLAEAEQAGIAAVAEQQALLDASFAKGAESAFSARVVADMLRTGAYSDSDVDLIDNALAARLQARVDAANALELVERVQSGAITVV